MSYQRHGLLGDTAEGAKRQGFPSGELHRGSALRPFGCEYLTNAHVVGGNRRHAAIPRNPHSQTFLPIPRILFNTVMTQCFTYSRITVSQLHRVYQLDRPLSVRFVVKKRYVTHPTRVRRGMLLIPDNQINSPPSGVKHIKCANSGPAWRYECAPPHGPFANGSSHHFRRRE